MLSASLSSSPFLPSSSPHATISATRRPPSPSSVSFRPQRAAATASCASPPCSSLYDVLGISMGATCQEIKAAYRNLARTCHPDVAAASGDSRVPPATAEEFVKVHAAYSTLLDPEKRADYDRTLFRQYRKAAGAYSGLSASPARFSGYYTRRNWETDQCW